MIKNFYNLIIGIILFIFLVFIVINYNDSKLIVIDNINIWIKYIVVSIGPTFIIGNLLLKYPFISFLFYPILKKIMHFENQKACSLFLLSILCGNPSTVILINDSFVNNSISKFEANRLLCFCSHSSFLFIINFYGLNKGLIIIFIQVISSIIISFLLKNKNNYTYNINNSNINNNIDFNNVINKIPNILFNVLIILIITSYIKWFLCFLFNDFILFDFLELTNGLIKFKNNFILSNILISCSGIAIILQVFSNIKKTDLSFNQFLKFRIIHMLIVFILSLLIVNFFV